jgi:O-antigen/teichoic acid export membrane protein
VLKSISYYTIISIVNATITFISTIYLSKLLSLEEFAYIGIFGTVIFILSPLISFNSVGLVAINIIDYTKNEYQKFINNYITFVIFMSLSFSIFLLLLYLLNLPYIQIIFLSYLIAIGMVFVTIHNSELIQNKNIKMFGVYKILSICLNLILIYLLVDLFKLSWQGRLQGVVISNILLIILMYLLTFDSLKNYRFKINFVLFKEYFKYGLPLVIGLGAAWMITQMDKYIVLYYFSMKELGIYSFGYVIGMSFIIINQSMVNAISPRIYKILKDGVGKNIIFKYSLYYNIFISIAVFLSILVIKKFDYLLLDKEYIKSVDVIILIMVATAFDGMYRIYGLVIDYYKENILRTKIEYSIVIINISFSLLLIPYYGILAPAIGTILAYLLGFIISRFYARKLLGLKGVK